MLFRMDVNSVSYTVPKRKLNAEPMKERKQNWTLDMAEKGMSINVTGNQGTAHSVYAIGIHQGPLNVNHSKDEERLCDLRDQTRKDIANWTRGMVRVSAIETTIEKFQKGHRWVTVTGNAGDGKTTLGYMTLKHRQDEGKEVFKIDTPEDFFMISRRTPDSVVLMNDVFGAFDFDQRAFSTWLPPIQTILERQAKDTVNEAGPSVIFVSRLNVLEAARNQLGKYGDVVLGEDEIVNPGKLNSDGEKVEILNFHLARHKISDIPESTKKELCSRSPHGFPHCCEMYVELRASGHAVDILKFFSSPLKFLNYTTQVLVDKQKYYDHFKILLKAGGQLDISRLRDATLRTEMQTTASSLIGSYLKTSENGVAFSHPSIHESVAVAVGNKDPVFAAQEFPISLIMQLPRKSENHLNIFFKESSSAKEALMQRLATEIRHGNYAVIQHEFFWERKFCEMLIESCVSNTFFPFGKAWNCVGINQRDSTGRILLHAAVRCHNYIAAKILLERGANVNISHTKNFLFFLAQSIFEIDPHHIVDIYGYVLHYACTNREVDASIIRLLIDHGAHINRVDENGMTALHYLCKENYMKREGRKGFFEIFFLRTRYRATDSMVFQADNWQTLLDHLCQKYGIDEKELDITRSSCGNRRLEAESEEAKVITMLIQNGADVNKTDKYGQTAFHLLCQRSRVDVRTVHLLLQNGASVNAATDNGNTPLHYICKRQKADISTLYLLTERSVDYTLKNKDGNTAIYFLCQKQNVRLGNFPR